MAVISTRHASAAPSAMPTTTTAARIAKSIGHGPSAVATTVLVGPPNPSAPRPLDPSAPRSPDLAADHSPTRVLPPSGPAPAPAASG